MSATSAFRCVGQALTKQKALIAILAMGVMMLLFKTNFYTVYNLLDLLKSASILEILAFGVTLTIICGGCDLSIGGTMCLSGIAVVAMINAGVPMTLAIAAAVALGGVVGFINGFLVVHQQTEPFIITLGMGMLLKGVCQQLTDAHPISCKNLSFMMIANGKLGPVPYLVIIMLVFLALTHCLLRYTQFGRNCYAIGGDYEVAVYSGINAVRIKWSTYVICGLMAAVAGVLLSSKLNSGSSTYGDNTALLVNCGVVVGGTSFAGGIGGIPQTAVGLLVFSVLENCMNMLGINPYIQQLAKGAVIVAIICFDCFGRKRKREMA